MSRVLVSAALALAVMGTTSATRVEVFEDGSAIEWSDGARVRTFPDGTFAWDCATRGDRICAAVPGQ